MKKISKQHKTIKKTNPVHLNCTVHPITLYKKDTHSNKHVKLFEIPRYGTVIRLQSKEQTDSNPLDIEHDGKIYKIPTVSAERHVGLEDQNGDPIDINDFCEFNKTALFIVPSLVANYVREHHPKYSSRFITPDTNKGAVRSDSGRILGTIRFNQY